MKKYEEFLQQISDITASGLQAAIEKVIIAALEPKLVAKAMLAVDKMLVGQAGRSRIFRKKTRANFGRLENMALPEGAVIPSLTSAQDFTYSTITITPVPYGIGDVITGEALAVADFNVLEQTKDSITDAWARAVDKYIWDKILGLTEGVNTGSCVTGANTVSLAHNKLLSWTSLTGSVLVTMSSVDYYDGKIAFSAAAAGTYTFSYQYSTLPNVRDALTKGKLSWEDLVAAKAKVVANYGDPDSIVIYQDEYNDLLVDSRFVNAAGFGAPVMIDEVKALAKVLGMDMVVPQTFFPGVGLVLQRGNQMGLYVIKEPMKVQIENIPRTKGAKFMSICEWFDVGVVNDTILCLITNCQADAADL